MSADPIVSFGNSRGSWAFAYRILLEHDFHFLALTLAAVLFGLLSDVADDKYATLVRNVDLPMLAPLVGMEQLQKKPEDLRVRWANGL